MRFYVENKKANNIADCVINHGRFSCMPVETAEMFSGLGRGEAERGEEKGCAEVMGDPAATLWLLSCWIWPGTSSFLRGS